MALGRCLLGRAVTALMFAACTSNVPTPAPTSAPTQAGLSAELSHFGSAGGLSFDFPAEWPVISDGGDMTGADATVVVLGTGAWNDGCVRAPNSVTCTGQQFFADPGEFVASIVTRGHGPAGLAYEAPPMDGSLLLDSGLAIHFGEGTDQSIQATIYVPGQREFDASFRFGSEATKADRDSVQAMLLSMDYVGDRRPTSITTWQEDPGDPPCNRATLQGQLSRGDMNGVNLSDPGWAVLSWPKGSLVRVSDLGRAEIVDKEGSVIAREWDEVSLGGHGDPNEFLVCADAIRVVREFPAD